VTFNQAFKTVLGVFSNREPKQIYNVTNAYLAAFSDVLSELGLQEQFVVPTVFRAIMETFPEVARISAAQHGKTFTKARFAAVIQPIASQMTDVKFKNATTVKGLAALFSKLIKKDFSI
jgi:hypothetical protein